MQVVTRRTGLSAEVLRMWERRHRVVVPARTQSGRRLYTDDDIERLRLLYRATLGGRTIGQIATLPTSELIELVRQDGEAERPRLDANMGWSDAPDAQVVIDACLRAIERIDAPGLDGILRRSLVELSAARWLDLILAPFLAAVGTRWREGTLRLVHEHVATVAARRALDRLIEAATAPGASPLLVVSTPVGQVHELGALMVAASAAVEGWAVAYLGPTLPAEDVAEAARALRARAVALSLTHPPNDKAVAPEMRRLATLLPGTTALLVGGAAATAYASVLDEVGAERIPGLPALRARLETLRAKSRTRGPH